MQTPVAINTNQEKREINRQTNWVTMHIKCGADLIGVNVMKDYAMNNKSKSRCVARLFVRIFNLIFTSSWCNLIEFVSGLWLWMMHCLICRGFRFQNFID